MAFQKKTWVDRLSEFAGRRLLTIISKSDTQMVVDVSRAEGNVSREGDPFSSSNMNDLEQRIADEFEEVNNDLAQQPEWIRDSSTGEITGYRFGGADPVFPFSSIQNATLISSDIDIKYAARAACSYNDVIAPGSYILIQIAAAGNIGYTFECNSTPIKHFDINKDGTGNSGNYRSRASFFNINTEQTFTVNVSCSTVATNKYTYAAYMLIKL